MIVDFGGKHPTVLETVEAQRTLGGELSDRLQHRPLISGSYSAFPYDGANMAIDLLLPHDQRSTGQEGAAVRVCYALDVILHVGEVS